MAIEYTQQQANAFADILSEMNTDRARYKAGQISASVYERRVSSLLDRYKLVIIGKFVDILQNIVDNSK